ncbi:hypothetical protein AVEN_78001-1 [Araneus ventricosus]|uniref:Uncharacterized protein n=1 Tax=Araneus ventricosus TaxID=182803 RepID=A0A4Y2MF51_ARAVE|nr:hypothetical protein AVEN_78001-1 [Araneus ventricosus]
MTLADFVFEFALSLEEVGGRDFAGSVPNPPTCHTPRHPLLIKRRELISASASDSRNHETVFFLMEENSHRWRVLSSFFCCNEFKTVKSGNQKLLRSRATQMERRISKRWLLREDALTIESGGLEWVGWLVGLMAERATF